MNLNKRLYNLYIKSYDWNNRKKKYINSLSSNLCELCHVNKWEEVHHQNYDSMDYDNPGNELDEHLLYVCKECHDSIHSLAAWKHSTNQRDMDEWLRLLEEINKIKRIEFKEKQKREEDDNRRKREEAKIRLEEHKKERELEESIRKKGLEEKMVNKIKKEKEESRVTIFVIVCTIFYFLLFKIKFLPFLTELDSLFIIFIFIVLYVIYIFFIFMMLPIVYFLLFVPCILLYNYFRNR